MCRGARAAPRAFLLPVSVLLSLSPCPSAVHVHGPPAAPKPYRERLLNIDDLQYHSTVHVGGQKLSAVIDSGSTELVVISDLCKTWCGALSHLYRVHNRTRSDVEQEWKTLSYGSGSLVVEQQASNFRVGPYTSHWQKFLQVVDANMPLLGSSAFAVIVGLGPQDPDSKENRWRMPHQLGIHSFGFCIGQAPGQPGYMTWNDDAHVVSPKNFLTLGVKSSGYWMVSLKNVRLGNRQIACSTHCAAILDSGTSLIGGPHRALDKISNHLAKLKADCSSIQKMPPLTFELDGNSFSLPPDAYIGQVSKARTRPAERVVDDVNNGTVHSCEPAILPVSIQSNLGDVWIMGMPFFRSYYTIFTLSRQPQLFVSKAAKSCQPSSGGVGTLFDVDANGTSMAARRITMEMVFQPFWLQKAMAAQRLDETNASSVEQIIH